MQSFSITFPQLTANPYLPLPHRGLLFQQPIKSAFAENVVKN
jgi:hypothetical protein